MYVHLEEEEEDFQTILLDDEHWDIEEIPDRQLHIHEHYVHIHVHIQITKPHRTMMRWI